MSGHGCGGGGCHGGNCSGCPNRGHCGGGGCGGGCCGPLGMVVFARAELEGLLAAVKGAPASTPSDKKNIVLFSEESGLVLKVGVAAKAVPCELVECDDIDPVVGWDFAKAVVSPSVDLVPVGLFAIVAPSVLEGALPKSTDPAHVFFMLFRGQTDGCIGQFSLRPLDYFHLDDAAYAAQCEPAVWPPKDVPPPSFVSAFVPDSMVHMCEMVRNEKHRARGEPLDRFLYASVKPEVGMLVYLHVVLDPRRCAAKPWTRLVGVVTEVEPLPADDAPVDPLIGESFYKHCTCGKPHPRAELVQQLGTIHGAKVHAVLYIAPEQVGQVGAEWAGQWDAVLVANDALQALWHLYGMGPRPRDKWVDRLPRVY